MTMTADEASAFAASKEQVLADRAAAIADGTIIRNDAGTWTNLDKCEVVGKDGLMQTGQDSYALVYTGPTPWHGLGVGWQPSYDGEILTPEKALVASGLDWPVEMRPIFAGSSTESNFGSLLVTGRRSRALVRVTPDGQDDVVLSVTGRIYRPVQNREAADFLAALVGGGNVAVETMGALGNGGIVFMSTLLGEDIELVGAGSTQDTIKKYVVVVNPHDGQRKFKARVTPIRPVCRNTVDWGEEGALTSWEIRHTTTIADKLKVAQESLGLAGVYYDKFATDAQAMISTRLTGKAFEQFLDQLWPVADEMKKTAKDNRYKVRDKVREIYEEDPQQAHIRKTAWGAAQAAIQYDDWETAVKPPKSLTEDVVRAHRVFTGDREDEKSRIRRAAMTLVNR